MEYIKENAGRIASGVFYTLLALAIIDLLIMGAMMLQIASGAPTPHIGFWDSQLSFIVRLLAH